MEKNEETLRLLEELKKAKESAEAANRAKSEFLANMSHEVRTPVSGILGAIDMMLTYNLDREIRQNLEMIKGSAKSLLRIINDILDFSKIEARKLELVLQNFDLYQMLEGIRQIFTIEADKKNLLLLLHINANVPIYLQGDSQRLRQVISNLVSNAIKFTKEGMVTINVSKTDAPSPPYNLVFSVSDTGIGISKDRFPDLFQSFTQLDTGYSRKYNGTGLGLAISKKLVEMMEGTIWVESEKNVGTTFYFRIVFQEAISTNDPHIQKTKQPSVEPEDIPPLKILLVEDDELNLISTEYFLKKAGHHVITASDGAKAVESFKQELFDIILMDLQLPEMDGIEATKAIRNFELGIRNQTIENSQSSIPYSPIPIIALTAYAMKGDRERILEAGMNDYICKPIEKYELFSVIKKNIYKIQKNPELYQNITSSYLQKKNFSIFPSQNNFTLSASSSFLKGKDSDGGNFSLPRLSRDRELNGNKKKGNVSFVADIRKYMKNYENDQAFLKEMLSGFINEEHLRMNHLNDAFLAKDFSLIAKAAHSMTNLASTIRVNSAANYSKELEKAARNHDLDKVQSLYESLKDEMEGILEYIKGQELLRKENHYV